ESTATPASHSARPRRGSIPAPGRPGGQNPATRGPPGRRRPAATPAAGFCATGAPFAVTCGGQAGAGGSSGGVSVAWSAGQREEDANSSAVGPLPYHRIALAGRIGAAPRNAKWNRPAEGGGLRGRRAAPAKVLAAKSQLTSAQKFSRYLGRALR